jgi:hypothetical protein
MAQPITVMPLSANKIGPVLRGQSVPVRTPGFWFALLRWPGITQTTLCHFCDAPDAAAYSI